VPRHKASPTLAGPLLGGEDTTLGGWVFGIIGLIAVPFILAPANAADRAAKAAATVPAAVRPAA
jgi:hypothetical protein